MVVEHIFQTEVASVGNIGATARSVRELFS